jgi:hypothetical protein
MVIEGKYYPYVQDSKEAFFATIFTQDELKTYQSWLKEAESLYQEAISRGLTPRLAKLQDLSFAKWIETFKEHTRTGIKRGDNGARQNLRNCSAFQRGDVVYSPL